MALSSHFRKDKMTLDIGFLIGAFLFGLIVLYLIYSKIDDIELEILYSNKRLNEKMKNIEAKIDDSSGLKSETCKGCGSSLQGLKYYYDDDWGVKGSKVFDESGHKNIGNLVYCPNCGTVKVIK